MNDKSRRSVFPGISLIPWALVFSLLPLNGCESNRSSPPKDWGSVSITLARGHIYTVTVRGPGAVEYNGLEGVPVRGRQLSTLSAEKIAAILQAMDRAKFMSMDDKAFQKASDVPYAVISLSEDGKKKEVRSIDTGGDHRLHLSISLFSRTAREQARFLRLADEIDALIGADRWTKCSPKCMLLVRASSVVESRDQHGATILLRAIESKKNIPLGSLDFDPDTMIEAGVDVNVPNDQGLTPLMAAAANGDATLVRDLLTHGADRNARDKKGRTALDFAQTVAVRDIVRPSGASIPSR